MNPGEVPGARPPGMPASVPQDPLTVPGGEPPTPPGRRPAAYIAVVVGLLAMVGGAVFFARSVGKSDAGAKTPVAAIQKVFDSLSNQDLLGVLETLTPSEREIFTGRLKALSSELGRLGILRKDLNLGSLSGIDLEFTGLTFKTEEFAPGYSFVEVTGGRSTYRVDPNESPLGDFVRNLIPASELRTISGSQNLAGQDAFFVAKQEDGEWYLSLFYSIAEAARRDAGAAAPRFGAGVAARGGATPEAAVDAFLRAVAGLDVRRLIELSPPDEMGALHDYAPLFLSAAEAGAAEARKHFTAQISSLELSSTTSGDEAVVKVKKMVFKFGIPALELSVESDGRCLKVAGGDFLGAGQPQQFCGTLPPVAGLPRLPTPDVGIVAVRRGGSWYVSPTRTTFDAIIGVLKTLKPSDLQQLKELVSQFGGLSGG